MAGMYRQPNRPGWFCAFIDSGGTRQFQSNKTGDRRQALRICRAWEQAAEQGNAGKLSPEGDLEVIARGVADLLVAANQEEVPDDTIRKTGRRFRSLSGMARCICRAPADVRDFHPDETDIVHEPPGLRELLNLGNDLAQ